MTGLLPLRRTLADVVFTRAYWLASAAHGVRFALRGTGRGELVLVYSPGHVGSTAMARTLAAAGLGVPVHDIHSLRRPPLRRHPVPSAREFLERRLARTLPRSAAPVRAVMCVREPIAADVSGYFQDLPRRDPVLAAAAHGEATPGLLRRLREDFLAREPHHPWIDRWLVEEAGGALGLDVYAQPFPAAAGFLHLPGPRVSGVMFRTEDLARAWGPGIAALLGRTPPPLRAENRGEDKAYARAYAAFRAGPLPASFVDEALGRRYARHFYSEEERARIRRRWVEGEGAVANRGGAP